jgi:hypothetical protein
VGSANFTRSGILSDGNWECLLHFTKDEKLYKDTLDAARRHFDAGIGFDECERATLSLVNRLQLLDKLATSFEELENYLIELYQDTKEIAEELVKWWRNKGGFILAELFYALGLAAFIAETDIDENTADLLLYVAPFAIRRVFNPTVMPIVLAALRPLGEKAPHRYLATLATATEREMLDGVAVQHIYNTVQQLWFHLLETDHRSSLVFAVEIYSDLLTKHSVYTRKLSEDILADMCLLYDRLRRKSRLLERGKGT